MALLDILTGEGEVAEITLPPGGAWTAPYQQGTLYFRPHALVVADGGNSPTTFKTDRTETTNDHFKDCLAMFVNGALVHQVKKVTGYNGSTKVLTVEGGFTGTPAAGTELLLIGY